MGAIHPWVGFLRLPPAFRAPSCLRQSHQSLLSRVSLCCCAAVLFRCFSCLSLSCFSRPISPPLLFRPSPSAATRTLCFSQPSPLCCCPPLRLQSRRLSRLPHSCSPSLSCFSRLPHSCSPSLSCFSRLLPGLLLLHYRSSHLPCPPRLSLPSLCHP